MLQFHAGNHVVTAGIMFSDGCMKLFISKLWTVKWSEASLTGTDTDWTIIALLVMQTNEQPPHYMTPHFPSCLTSEPNFWSFVVCSHSLKDCRRLYHLACNSTRLHRMISQSGLSLQKCSTQISVTSSLTSRHWRHMFWLVETQQKPLPTLKG